MIQMLGHLAFSQRSLRLSSFLLIHFSFFLSVSFISTILCSTSLNLSPASIILLLFPSRVFFLSYLLHCSLYVDSFFIASRSLLTFLASYWSLSPGYLSVTPICFQDFGLFSLSFGIIYQVDSLSLPIFFGLVGIYPVPLPVGYFSAFLSCLYCYVWDGLSVFWQFVVPLYCGGSSRWVGSDEWLVKVCWLGKLVSVFWWVKLDFFSLEWNEVTSSEFWDVYRFGVTLDSLYIEAQFYVPVLLKNLHDISYSGTCWPLHGAWFQCRYGGFDELLWLMFPGIRRSLVFSGFGLRPPASGFQYYSYSSFKTSPSI